MLGHTGWKTRFCFVVFGLGLYLVVSALISTRRLSFPPNNDDFNGGAEVVSPFEGAGASQAPENAGKNHHPRNLAAAVAFNQRLSPRRMRTGPQIEWCKAPLGYKAAPGPLVALASFPGSGNTWLRYLLQQATGILTGSVYKDYALLKNGFPAENVNNGSVLAVKTHEFGPDSRNKFDRVILLVRDPFASLKAEFNRRSGGHTGHASLDRYKRNGGRYWRNFVNSKGGEWEKMNLDWYDSFSEEDRLVVFYDQLTSAPMAVLQTVLDFLRVSVSKNTLQCVMARKEGIYKRSKKNLGLDVFTDDMRKMLNDKQRNLYTVLHRTELFTSSSSDVGQKQEEEEH